MKKSDFNKTLIGKTVLISSKKDWKGKIVDVVDEENFKVESLGKVSVVNIFDIKSTQDQN